MQRIICFYDIICPNSWLTIQTLLLNKQKLPKVHFEPVCDFKIGILHNSLIWNNRGYRSRIWKRKEYKNNEVDVNVENILPRIDKRGKELIAYNGLSFANDWQEIYANAVNKGSIVPQLLLASFKQRKPEMYIDAIIKIGRRLWDDKLPVHYGSHMFTVCKQLGVSFKETEDIIARLSTIENRSVININCKEVVKNKFTESPCLLLQESASVKAFSNVNSLLSTVK